MQLCTLLEISPRRSCDAWSPAGCQQPEPGWSQRCTARWCPCRRWSGAKRLPLWGSWLAEGQTEEVPFDWLRAFIVAEARGAAWGEDLIRLAASRQSTFPIGGRLRNALRPASIRVVFKVDGITLWGRYQSQTEPYPAPHIFNLYFSVSNST